MDPEKLFVNYVVIGALLLKILAIRCPKSNISKVTQDKQAPYFPNEVPLLTISSIAPTRHKIPATISKKSNIFSASGTLFAKIVPAKWSVSQETFPFQSVYLS